VVGWSTIVVLVVFAWASPAPAQMLGSVGRVVMIEGYWEPESAEHDGGGQADPEVRMHMELATLPDGHGLRSFAVTATRAYFDADSSLDPFRRAGLRPAFNLRGREELLARMLAVPPGEPITIVASWTERSADLLVAEVHVDDAGSDDTSD
jgi:hypothetical protein